MALGSLFSNLFGSSKGKTPEVESSSPGAALDKRITQRRASVEQAVTEAMMDAGVVSSGYRHEVRAVDERGHHFQVAIDLPKELAAVPAALLARVGATIVRKARTMNGGEVMGVYWQVAHDGQLRNQEPLNLMAAARNAQPAPVEPPAPAAPSAAEISAERVARLREMMKDEPPRGGAKASAAGAAQAAPAADDEPDHGFANTVMGFDADDTPAKKR